MIKKTLLLLLACSLSILTFAQTVADIQLPKVIPPSPDAAALGKFAQIPVDKSTGIPDISIPLYEIKTPRLSLPISIAYHASGIRVDEISSWVGAGWALNAGGVVTRSIIGLPDDSGYGFLTAVVKKAADLRFPADSAYMQLVANGVQDTQPDNFFYNFNNHSGAFVFGEDKNPVLTPYKPLKISFSTTTGIDIIDESGNKYNFNTKEMVSSTVHVSFDISSWYLTSIVSADRTDTIKFVYTTDTAPQNEFSYIYTQNFGAKPAFNTLGAIGLWPLVQNTNERTYNPVRVRQILFNGGKVDFIPKGGRLDNANFSLDSVIVSSYSTATKLYSRIKSFKLMTSYFVSTIQNPPRLDTTAANRHRLILTDLLENDQNNTAVKTHHFDYNPTMLPPVHNFGQDLWGYYNGKSQNATLLKSQQITSGTTVFTVGGTEGGDRSVSPSFAQAGILQKITYPTKGYTVLSYEGNQQQGNQFVTYNLGANAEGYYQETSTVNYTPTGGMLSTGGTIFHIHIVNPSQITLPTNPYVQLKQVSNGNVLYTATATSGQLIDVTLNIALTANVQYQLVAVAQGGSPTVDYLPSASITTTYQVPSSAPNYVGGLRVKSLKNYDSNGTIISTESYKYGDGESGQGQLIWGSLMSDYTSHTFWFNLGRTVQPDVCGYCPGVSEPSGEATYSNNSVYQLSTLNGSPVGYSTVSIYHGDSVQNIGKSLYYYNINGDSLLFTPNQYNQGIKLVPVTWKNGEPIYEAHYRNNGSNQYLLEQEKYTNYSYLYRTAARGLIINDIYEAYDYAPQNYPYWTVNDFYFFDYPISSGSRVPNQTTTINYAVDGVTKLTQDTIRYYYDNLSHVQPTRIVTYDGEADSLLKRMKYPQDMVNAGLDPTGVYAAMTTANNISPVIQFTEFKNAKQLQQSITNYSSTNGIYNPQNVSLQVLNNPAETRLGYLYYNNGNLKTVSKTGGPPVSYQWGYNNTYPVAQASNSTAADIFYDSFEEGDGNSTIGDSKTGHYSHTGTYSKALTGLDNGTYTLSYWQETAGIWSLIVNNAVPVSGGIYSINLSTQIDDVRFYPSAAQMTTYTYDPLIGITSSTDAKNETTYYEYDSFQRLMNIKDKDRNILKHTDYHYQGQ